MKKIILSLLAACATLFMAKATILFDPATFDATKLPAGYAIVDTAGGKYLRIVLNGWSSSLTIPEVTIQEKIDLSQDELVKAKIKMAAIGGSAAADDDITKFEVKAFDIGGKLDKFGEFKEFDGKCKVQEGKVTSIQFWAQSTTDWNAIVGTILYVGKIESYKYAATKVKPHRVAEAKKLPADQKINMDGNDIEDFWAAAKEEKVDRPALLKVGDIEYGNPGAKEVLKATLPATTSSSGSFKAVWDTTALYLFVSAKDDKPLVFPTPGKDPWMHDGVELFTDMKNRRLAAPRANGQQQFRGNLKKVAQGHGDIKGPDTLRFAWVVGASSWSCEVKLPWKGLISNLNYKGDSVKYLNKIKAGGDSISFEISIIDSDEAKEGGARISIINWANPVAIDTAYRSSKNWGALFISNTLASSINEVASVSINVANPVSNEIVAKAEGLTAIEVYSSLGQKVAEAKGNGIVTVNVAGLTSGAYIVKATVKGKAVVTKVIKK